MARRKKDKGGGVNTGMWIVTFSDLVTLLLTFFVLILSMSSMDVSILTRVNLFVNDVGFVTKRSAGKVPSRVDLVLQLLERPLEVLKKPNRFKDLLFPQDVLPPEIDRSTVLENIEVMRHPEGLALVLNDELIFPRDSAELSDKAKAVLRAIFEVLLYTPADVNVSGFSSISEGQAGGFELSAERALAVLNFFVQNGLEQRRFSVAGYGPNLPLETGVNQAEQDKNRRVAIIVKSTPHFAGYQSR